MSDKDQAEVQANMQTKVLEWSVYPEIVFQSTHVQRKGDNAWKVSGDLTLHGVTKSLTLDVAREKRRVRRNASRGVPSCLGWAY